MIEYYLNTMNPALNLLTYSLSPSSNKMAGDIFFKWLDLAVRSAVNNNENDYPEIFPIYENNDETRNMLRELSKPLKGSLILTRPVLEKLTDDILNNEDSSIQSLGEEEKKLTNLLEHILVNQIYQNGFSDDVNLNQFRECLLEHLAIRKINLPEGFDINKIAITSPEFLKKIFFGLTTNTTQATVKANIEFMGLKATIKKILSDYEIHDDRCSEAQEAIAEYAAGDLDGFLNLIESDFLQENLDYVDLARSLDSNESLVAPDDSIGEFLDEAHGDTIMGESSSSVNDFTNELAGGIADPSANVGPLVAVFANFLRKSTNLNEHQFLGGVLKSLFVNPKVGIKLLASLTKKLVESDTLDSTKAELYLSTISSIIFGSSNGNIDSFITLAMNRIQDQKFNTLLPNKRQASIVARTFLVGLMRSKTLTESTSIRSRIEDYANPPDVNTFAQEVIKNFEATD